MKTRKFSDAIFDAFIYVFIAFAGIITLYPFVYVASMSISKHSAVLGGKVWLLPIGFSLRSYRLIFDNSDVWNSYYNTIWYVVVGTMINITMTMLAAYPLSKKEFMGRNFFMFVMVFTMYFSGGLIPSYLLVKRLGLYNTRWAIVIPGAVSVFYVIIMREFIKSIPVSLEESAAIEGANPFVILVRIILPLSKAAITAISLFYAVGHWNSFFAALIYLPDARLHPIQLFLRKVLIQHSRDLFEILESAKEQSTYAIQLKYSLTMVTILPIVCVYPFLQKYFIKGVMIGAIKY